LPALSQSDLAPPARALLIRIVLVSPRNPLNIGAAARAMANFGFSDLAVVAPHEPIWHGARSAVGAPDLLANAQIFSTLAEAVAACTLVLGTGTLTYRRPEQPIVSLPDLAPLIRAELARSEVARQGRARTAAVSCEDQGVQDQPQKAQHSPIALIFGPEKHGLTRKDLCNCHRLVEIPTDPHQPSMNLGQAVAVCLYELATRVPIQAVPIPIPIPSGPIQTGPLPSLALATYPVPDASPEPASTSANLDRLAGVIEETMLAAGYSPFGMQNANRRDFRLLLRRLAPGPSDTRRILGLFRRILYRLRKVPERNPPAE
jgi:tRNA C32,U32 (ribose-2'-O)-methylase TrmJ